MLRFARIISAVILAALLASAARAQSVRWEPSGGSLGFGQSNELSLIFDDCEPAGDVTLPEVNGLTFGQPTRGEQSSFTVVNGRASRVRTVYLTYSVRPTARQAVSIPAFEIETDRGTLQVPAVSFDVSDPTVGGSPLESAVSSRVTFEGETVWAGEVFPINYTLSVTDRFRTQLASGPEWDSSPLVVEEWSQPEPFRTIVSGEPRTNVRYTSRGSVSQPGRYTFDPVNQLVNVQVPATGFSLFQAYQAQQFTVTSNEPSVVVRPLPQPAPPAFTGAVGQFQLTSRIVPETATVSEPVTWTLELTGTGNWPEITGLPAREASRDFRVVQPQAKRTNAEGALFEASLTEDVVLVPTRPGTYTLGPVTWSYFDPATGSYQTVSTESVSVTISAAQPAQLGNTPPVAPAVSDVPAEPPAAPAAPAPIPRDPLPGSAAAPVPWSNAALVGGAMAAVGWLPLFWLALAWRRARATDPLRARREAKERLLRTLSDLGTERDAVRIRTLLLQWQHEAAALWGLHRAAPTASSLASKPEWMQLWAEADRVIYGNDTALPAGWTGRAEAAVRGLQIASFAPHTLFLPRNLFPFLAALVFIAASPISGGQPLEAYARSEFTEAEQAWREQVAVQPTDWIAHHNLALALAQQDRWGEAAAHAAAAFLQQPSNHSVQWHLALTLEQARYAPPSLSDFVQPGPREQLARMFSPARWQRLMVGAAVLASLAIAALLLQAYGHGADWLRPAAWGILGMALLVGGIGVFSLRTYGLAADARSVLVWQPTTLRSIPTEADTTQQTSVLPAGTLAIIDHTFLGWLRLAFPDGQTGWVREEDVVKFYR